MSSSNPLGCIDGLWWLACFFIASDVCVGGERFVKSFRDRFNEGMSDQESQRFIEVRRSLHSHISNHLIVYLIFVLVPRGAQPSPCFIIVSFLYRWRVTRCPQSLISTAEENLSMRMYDGVQKLLGTQD